MTGRGMLSLCHVRNPSRAWSIRAMPDFMSSAPGPHRRPSATRHGMVESVPSGYTVSMWPSSRTGLPPRAPAKSTCRWSPKSWTRWNFAWPPIFSKRPARRAPSRSTACLLSLGDLDFYQLADGLGDRVFSLGKETQPIRNFAGGLGLRWLRLLQDLLHMGIVAVFRGGLAVQYNLRS